MVVSLPPSVVLTSANLMGFLVRDVVLTREEIDGLMSGHLVSQGPPTARTRLTDWMRDHRDTLGRHYASELARHYR